MSITILNTEKTNPIYDLKGYTYDYLLEQARAFIAIAEESSNLLLEASVDDITMDMIDNPAIGDFFVVYSVISLKSSLQTSEEGLDAVNEVSTLYNDFYSEHINNEKLYQQYITFYEKRGESLTDEQRYILKTSIESLEDNGVHLPDSGKKKVHEIRNELNALCTKYDANIQKAKDAIELWVSGDITGLDDDQMATLVSLPSKTIDGVKHYCVDYACGLLDAILNYCDDAVVRKQANDLIEEIGVKEGNDNRLLVQNILNLRHSIALLHKHPNASTQLMQRNMVTEPDTIIDFINDLYESSKDKYKTDDDEFFEYGTKLLGRKPKRHDYAYVARKMAKEQINLDNRKIREYLTESNVLNTMFGMLHEFYGLTFTELPNDTLMHESSKLYRVENKETGKHYGQLMLDLYQRSGKRGGGFCGSMAEIAKDENGNFTKVPYVYIVSNNVLSIDGENLFFFDDMITLYHEMGHALHHFLADNTDESLNGTGMVQSDAVEFPSQFMENFCYMPSILKSSSGHVKTGETIPDDLIKSIIDYRTYRTAVYLFNRCHAMELDMLIHNNVGAIVSDVEDEVLAKYYPNDNNRRKLALHPTLAHIFTYGYSSNLHAYSWSEMMACDAFDAFLEAGDEIKDQKEVALKFRDTIFAKAGYGDMRDHFKAFRGREVDNTSFLKINGLI